MLKNFPIIFLFIVLSTIFAGCVTTIDKQLPYPQLPEITILQEVELWASPKHPESNLPLAAIPAGAKVSLIGKDKDGSSLLVEYNNMLGWMPFLFAHPSSSVGNITPAVVVDPLPKKYTQYLKTLLNPQEIWINDSDRSVIVQGSIFLPSTKAQFKDATLTLEIVGKGKVEAGDYVYTQLTSSSAVVLFTFSVADLQKDSTLRFLLADSGNEPISFEAVIFSNECSQITESLPQSQYIALLPIGQPKHKVTKLSIPKNSCSPIKSTPEATPINISTPSIDNSVSENWRPHEVLTETIIISKGELATQSPLWYEIEELLAHWDVIHHEVAYNYDTSNLSSVLMGKALQKHKSDVETIRSAHCYWKFVDLEPQAILSFEQISETEVQVEVRKHWDGRLYCNGVFNQKNSFSAPFKMRYRVLKTDTWRIVEKVDLGFIGDSQTPPYQTPPQTDSEGCYSHDQNQLFWAIGQVTPQGYKCLQGNLWEKDGRTSPGASPGVSPHVQTPNPIVSVNQPAQFIRNYYDEINNRNYSLTWSKLSPRFQHEANNDNFAGYANFFGQSVEWVDVLTTRASMADPQRPTIYVTLQIYQTDQCVRSEYHVFGLIPDVSGNSWLIDKQDISQQSLNCSTTHQSAPTRTPTPISQPLQVGDDFESAITSVQTYYASVNQQDFDTAYNSLSAYFKTSAGLNRSSFQQGYAGTGNIQLTNVSGVHYGHAQQVVFSATLSWEDYGQPKSENKKFCVKYEGNYWKLNGVLPPNSNTCG